MSGLRENAPNLGAGLRTFLLLPFQAAGLNNAIRHKSGYAETEDDSLNISILRIQEDHCQPATGNFIDALKAPK